MEIIKINQVSDEPEHVVVHIAPFNWAEHPDEHITGGIGYEHYVADKEPLVEDGRGIIEQAHRTGEFTFPSPLSKLDSQTIKQPVTTTRPVNEWRRAHLANDEHREQDLLGGIKPITSPHRYQD